MKAIIVLIFFVLASLSADEEKYNCTISKLDNIGFRDENYGSLANSPDSHVMVHIPSIKYDKNTKIAKVWLVFVYFKGYELDIKNGHRAGYRRISMLIDYKNNKHKNLDSFVYSCDGNILHSYKYSYEQIDSMGWEDIIPDSVGEIAAREIKKGSVF